MNEYDKKLKDKMDKQSMEKLDNIITQFWDKETSPNHRMTPGPGADTDKQGSHYSGGGPGAMNVRKKLMKKYQEQLNDKRLQEYRRRQDKRQTVKDSERSA